jgi:hypothetical protein
VIRNGFFKDFWIAPVVDAVKDIHLPISWQASMFVPHLITPNDEIASGLPYYSGRQTRGVVGQYVC